MSKCTQAALAAAIACISGSSAIHGAAPRAYQRPLSDFINAQGATTVNTPPVPDYLAWTSGADGFMVAVDYAGIANSWTELHSGGAVSYGTEITGSIRERVLDDGRAEVQVTLRATNALTYVVGFDPVAGPDYGDVKFGNLAPEALASGDAALGDCNFQIRFINSAPHAPLPDLFDSFVLGNAAPGVELLFLSFHARASGSLHEGALPEAPEGTPGTVVTVQTGIFMTGFHGAVNDGFPAERVILSVAP